MRLSALFIAVGLVYSLAFRAIAQERTSSAAVQPERSTGVLGTVVRGNTTIIFESAGTHGIDLNGLLKSDQFAEEHPKIATALAYRPSLINDSGYLKKHPELATFFQQHPILRMRWKKTPATSWQFHHDPGNNNGGDVSHQQRQALFRLKCHLSGDGRRGGSCPFRQRGGVRRPRSPAC